ncbi:MAG: sodium ion-translocating decarboxylase subunit beta, partial [Myxococcales bacterium]
MLESLQIFFSQTGFSLLPQHPQNLLMICVGLVLITLAIRKEYEPLLLIPIGFGIIMGNIPGAGTSPDESGVIHYLYFGIKHEIYPALIFLGLGAMTDFSALLSQPRLMLLGAAAQFGIFATYCGAMYLGFTPQEAGAIGIIGGADGPTTIFITAALAPDLLPAVAVAAYSYMAMVPIIQPPIVRALTTRKERLIKMKAPRAVTKTERILFPVVGFITCVLVAPKATTLLGMLFFGNLLKESGVTDRLANTAKTAFIDSITIILGLCVGAGASAERFLRADSLKIFVLGLAAFSVATASGVLLAKLMNRFSRDPINPIIGAAGVSAVPMAARVALTTAQRED